MLKIIISLVSGLLFGAGMIISQMVEPSKVIGFLDVTGKWDASLAFVIIGALLVFTPCYHFTIKKRTTAINGDIFLLTTHTKIDKNLICGAVLFGAGWGIAGLCPGPALTSISSGSISILSFIVSMAIGMYIAKKLTRSK